MLQIPLLTPTPESEAKITRICVLSETLKSLPIPTELAVRIFQKQYLRSSLFSARIEGNTLTFEDISPIDLEYPKQKGKKELANNMRALHLLSRWNTQFSAIYLQEIHQTVLRDLAPDAGKFRREQTAIFDAFGNAVYLTPDKETMNEMLTAFLSTWNHIATPRDMFLHLAPLHLFFEKIHPFVDGNGRVGRVLLHLLLFRFEVAPKDVVIPIDQYFEEHRDKYYFFLEHGAKTIDEFTLFLFDSIIWGFEQILTEIKNSNTVDSSQSKANILPRREEILKIITDHPYCSLDFIARRFLTIPKRTLAYDVNWLVKEKLVNKHGATRGVSYSCNK